MTNLWGQQFRRADVLTRVGQLDQVAGVRLITLGDGGARGVRVLEFSTGSGFRFDVLVDRGFDVGHCEHSGRSLAWESGVGVQGPWFAEHEGFGFFRTFGAGLLTTCGMEHILMPTEDTAEQYGWEARQTESFGLHGRVSNRPARLVGYGSRWKGDDCILWAEGEVLQAAVHAERLLLRRRIETHVGQSFLTVHDEIENVGHKLTPHMYMYHVNFGFPAVDDGSRIVLASSDVTSARAHHGIVPGYETLDAPSNSEEQVYENVVVPETDGSVPVGIINRKFDFGAYQVFNHNQLEHHATWRMLGEGVYVVGLEPSTNSMAGRAKARELGELIQLEPGETRVYDLELGALHGSSELDAFESRVKTLSE
jgi:hypothetical protein